MRRRDDGQPTLFDDDARPARLGDEPADVRQRQRNRERQRVWRQRHTQFLVPMIESPTGEMFTVEGAEHELTAMRRR